MRRLAVVLLAGFVVGLVPQNAWAHKMRVGYAALEASPRNLALVLNFDLKDMQEDFSLDPNKDAVITEAELAAALPAVFDYVRAHLHVSADGHELTLASRAGKIAADAAGQEWLKLEWEAPLASAPRILGMTLDPSFFEIFGQTYNLLVKVTEGQNAYSGALSLGTLSQKWTLSAKSNLWSNVSEFTRLGVEHIFLGYDHLMFLFALLLLGGRLRSLLKIVTAFTVAHSITLILAATGAVQLPGRLVETGIALSIAYVAAENLFFSKTDHRWVITFVFGLVHGFGFAGVLREIGLPTEGLIASLLAFNVGVEIGQVTIVAVFFPVVFWIAKQRFHRGFVMAASGIIFLFGVGWAIERALGLSFMPF